MLTARIGCAQRFTGGSARVVAAQGRQRSGDDALRTTVRADRRIRLAAVDAVALVEAAVGLFKERRNRSVLHTSGNDGPERGGRVERSRGLIFALTVAGLHERRRDGAERIKIGRASCGERGCQYGENRG